MKAPLVRSFHHAVTGSWTHVAVDPGTRRAAIIDAVLDFDASSGRISTASVQRLLEYVATAGLEVEWILETHAHADHLSAGAWLCERLGAPLAIGARIVEVQRTFKRILALEAFAADGSDFDRLLDDGDRLALGELDIRILATPGHTPDSVSYLIGDALFVGDTLFAPDAGTARCDFPGGDAATLWRSIRRLYELPEPTRLFLCHDYPETDSAPRAESTIGAAKSGNVHLREDTEESDYVALRARRDATLPVPRLLWPAIQFNLRGGRLPPVAENHRSYLKLPAGFADD